MRLLCGFSEKKKCMFFCKRKIWPLTLNINQFYWLFIRTKNRLYFALHDIKFSFYDNSLSLNTVWRFGQRLNLASVLVGSGVCFIYNSSWIRKQCKNINIEQWTRTVDLLSSKSCPIIYSFDFLMFFFTELVPFVNPPCPSIFYIIVMANYFQILFSIFVCREVMKEDEIENT